MRKKLYFKFSNASLGHFLNHPLIALSSHWLFQGLLYMDNGERWFKITIDIAMTLLIWLVIKTQVNKSWVILIAFLAAHTINFLFNSHLWSALKFYIKTPLSVQEHFWGYLQGILERASKNTGIEHIYIVGGISRGEWTSSSDLDIRVVRHPGFWSGLKAFYFATQERARAFLAHYPIDIYVLDSKKSLNKLNQDEPPID